MSSKSSIFFFFGLSENEIKTIEERNPTILKAEPEDIFDNIKAVVKAGYPEEDLNVLIYNNPFFLTYTNSQLTEKINKIKLFSSNFEKTIKNNFNAL